MTSGSPTGFPLALPGGSRIDHYEIIRVLGIGNFGVTYEAYSHRYHSSCVIKELLPGDYATRESATKTILPISENLTDIFNHCRRDFQREATILHAINHPNVMKILDIFDANGTSYYVMPYARGTTFEEYFIRRRADGGMPESELLGILHRVADGLEKVHQLGYLHRDIKPENILITDSGEPILIDFGAARQLIGSRSRPMSAILTRGYAPFEQYSVTQNQGPYTDIYALGAVFHRVITGQLPPESPDRVDMDPYQPLLHRQDVSAYSAAFRSAIDWALKPGVKERPQNIGEWRRTLPPAPAMARKESAPVPPPHPGPVPQVPAGFMSSPPGTPPFDLVNEITALWGKLPPLAKLGGLLLIPFFFISVLLFVILKIVGG